MACSSLSCSTRSSDAVTALFLVQMNWMEKHFDALLGLSCLLAKSNAQFIQVSVAKCQYLAGAERCFSHFKFMIVYIRIPTSIGSKQLVKK